MSISIELINPINGDIHHINNVRSLTLNYQELMDNSELIDNSYDVYHYLTREKQTTWFEKIIKTLVNDVDKFSTELNTEVTFNFYNALMKTRPHEIKYMFLSFDGDCFVCNSKYGQEITFLFNCQTLRDVYNKVVNK